MFQLRALIWLKWKLFRNALRSRRAVVSQAASLLTTLAALGLALILAFIAGAVGWASASSEDFSTPQKISTAFLILTFIYMLWAVLPVTMGSGREFDPARLLLYPVSLSKLFALDFLSDLTGLASIFGIPIVLALALGVGIGSGQVLLALPVAFVTIAFGLALSKFVMTSLGALLKRKRTRGETLIALVGVVIGLGGAFMGQLMPYFMQHSDMDFAGLRWTPPGASAVALMQGLTAGDSMAYILSLLTLAAYTSLLVFVTYRIARRSALGIGGAKRPAAAKLSHEKFAEQDAGWHLPFVSAELSALLEKELRYALRNAQVRMLALMPLMLIAFRLLPTGGQRRSGGMPAAPDFSEFALYGEGLFAALGILYVFLLLSSLACNVFAFEGGGMRALILSPVNRRLILIAKNTVTTLIATGFALLLLAVNQVVFRDLTFRALIFVLLCLPVFGAMMMLVGNWLSLRFPKGMKFGKRMNISGMAGLLLLPLALAMAVPPVLSAAAGYLAQSLAVKYVTLALFAFVAVALYRFLITKQGQELARREQEILEAVK
jgi:hypothetical protein